MSLKSRSELYVSEISRSNKEVVKLLLSDSRIDVNYALFQSLEHLYALEVNASTSQDEIFTMLVNSPRIRLEDVDHDIDGVLNIREVSRMVKCLGLPHDDDQVLLDH